MPPARKEYLRRTSQRGGSMWISTNSTSPRRPFSILSLTLQTVRARSFMRGVTPDCSSPHGADTLFDPNWQAFVIPADRCFPGAHDEVLRFGERMETQLAEDFSADLNADHRRRVSYGYTLMSHLRETQNRVSIGLVLVFRDTSL